VRVGISLDGPADIHDRHRKTRSGRGTHREVMLGIERLRNAKLPFHVIAVVTADALDHADAIVDFFEQHGIVDLAFNVEELEGMNPCSSLAGAEDHVAVFFRRIFERALVSDGRLHVREFERSRDALLWARRDGVRRDALRRQRAAAALRDRDGRYGGNFSSSRRSSSASAIRFDGFALGNVHRDRLIDVLVTERFEKLFGEIVAGVDRCARDCRYYFLCGGGAPANKLFENERFDSSETAFCRNSIQRPLDVSLALLESLAGQAPKDLEATRQTAGAG
jgi:uncharacterized protein